MLSYIGLRYVVEQMVVSIKRFGGIYAEFTDLGLIRPRGGGPGGQPYINGQKVVGYLNFLHA